MVYFIMLVETHPYYNGIFLSSFRVIVIIATAAISASILANFFLAFFVTKNSNLSILLLASIVIYPAFAYAINFFFYKQSIFTNAIYFVGEFVKFLILYLLEEGQREKIQAVNHSRSREKIRAMSYMAQNLFMAIIFAICGPVITYLS